MGLGPQLRNRRKELRLTLQEVETQTGVSFTHLSEIERGLSQPSLSVLRKLAAFLRVKIEINGKRGDRVKTRKEA